MLNKNSELEFNAKGYLINFGDWRKDFNIQLANEHNVELMDYHWHGINLLMEYQSEYAIEPDPR